jgi:hypothetical protein
MMGRCLRQDVDSIFDLVPGSAVGRKLPVRIGAAPAIPSAEAAKQARATAPSTSACATASKLDRLIALDQEGGRGWR